jgi:hypothetical protein
MTVALPHEIGDIHLQFLSQFMESHHLACQALAESWC